MVSHLSFWLLLTVLISAPSTNDGAIAYVRSSNHATCPDQPCLMLNEYAREQDQYFLDGASFVFLPGIHQLDLQLQLENISNVSLSVLEEDGSAQILLSPMVNITWLDSKNITITGLEVFLSGQSDDGSLFSALVFTNSSSLLSNLSLFGNDRLQSTAIRTNSSLVELSDVVVSGATSMYGAALFAFNSTINFAGNNYFVNNTATQGGAMSIGQSVANFYGNTSFVNNTAIQGGAITFNQSVTHFRGNILFVNNTAFTSNFYPLALGGAIYCENSVLSFSSSVIFQHNQAVAIYWGAKGGGILAEQNSVLKFETSSSVAFTKNSAMFWGGAISISESELKIHGKTLFEGNFARFGGGALRGEVNSRIFCSSRGEKIVFQSNHVGDEKLTFGGAIFTQSSHLVLEGIIFERNMAKNGGAISSEGFILHISTCDFHNNTSSLSGGAVYLTRVNAVFDGTNNFQWNVANVNSVNMTFSGENINSSSNSVVERGGAIYTIDGTISLSGSQRFILNSAQQGGAIAIDSSSKLVLTQPLQASFIQNSASVGGAIFYEDVISASQCTKSSKASCFIELDSTSNIQLSFVNNTAGLAGTILYGGNIDHCRLYIGRVDTDSCGKRTGRNYTNTPIAVIEEISDSFGVDTNTSNISSDPLQICFCENDIPYCSHRVIDTVRGKEFTLMAMIIGQNSGIVPSSVRTSLDNDIKISATQRIQYTKKECIPITYRLSSNKNTIRFILFPDGPCRDTGISHREITVNFLPCPDGFTLDGSECVCDKRLQRYTNSCNVDDNSIERNSNTFWMGAVFENETFGGLILHSGCPFDYCIETPVFLVMDNLDIQCNHNHSGTLCGSCISGYSITFGTLHCLPCSNAYLALILPFALAGIALVAILLLLQISVASGTLNGLIFYANVIQVNRSIFFPPGDTNILTVFIAWLNLDLGIETCFFDGMNTYIFTWLQFVFPFYVWFLIGLIIVASQFSSKIAHALGKNPATTLATLVLLSYSKILRTVIVTLSSTSLEYPGNTTKVVWLYDGNIPYFQSASHIVLGTFAIAILMFLFLPYTLLLLCGHWLQGYSDRWIFSWLNKIKPFLDAYHAPYKKDSRYWTGFILLIRCALFLTFAFGNTSVSLLAIISVTASLAALAWVHIKIYENIFNGFLEAAFLLNLCILAAGTYHVKESGGSQAGLAYTSVGIALVIFICILVYHVYLRLRTLGVWEKIPKPDSKRYTDIFSKLHIVLGHNKEKDNEAGVLNGEQEGEIKVTTTTIELREPLLEN